MFTEFQINAAHFRAFQEVIARHTIVILTDRQRGVGTGTLVSRGSTNLILTANHNLIGTPPSELRFGFKPEGNFQETPMGELSAVARTILPSTVHALKFQGDIVRDEKTDIAALVLARDDRPRDIAEFYDASALHPAAIKDGTSVLMLGFPVGYSADVGQGQRLVGATPDHLVYDSSLNHQRYLPSSYDPEREFLLKYRWIEDGLLPHGFSGAATWCNREQPKTSAIWTPSPLLMGLITGYLGEQRLLVVAGLQAICDLLSRV